jgi:hypothetical protein
MATNSAMPILIFATPRALPSRHGLNGFSLNASPPVHPGGFFLVSSLCQLADENRPARAGAREPIFCSDSSLPAKRTWQLARGIGQLLRALRLRLVAGPRER